MKQFVGDLKKDEVGELILNLSFTEGGPYTIKTDGKMWISIFDELGKRIGGGSTPYSVRMGPGAYTLRIKHADGEGKYSLSVKRG